MDNRFVRVHSVAKILKKTPRAIQSRCEKDNLTKDKEGYLIPITVYKGWLMELKRTKEVRNEVTKRKSIEKFVKVPILDYKRIEIILQEQGDIKKDILKEREYKDEQIRTLKDNLKLANNRIDVLINSIPETISTLQQQNTLKYLDKTKID